MKARARLGVEDQSRWDDQFIGGLSKLTTAAERHEELTQIPIGVPDAIPKKTWKKKKNKKNKADARGLTTVELTGLEKAEEIKRGKARAATPEDIDEDEEGFLVPDSPLPFPARAGESQSGATITISPPPMRRPPPPISPDSPGPPPRSLSHPGLPPSTAPPRLEQEQEEGRGKRKRVYRNLQVRTRAGTTRVAWALVKLIHQGLIYKKWRQRGGCRQAD